MGLKEVTQGIYNAMFSGDKHVTVGRHTWPIRYHPDARMFVRFHTSNGKLVEWVEVDENDPDPVAAALCRANYRILRILVQCGEDWQMHPGGMIQGVFAMDLDAAMRRLARQVAR